MQSFVSSCKASLSQPRGGTGQAGQLLRIADQTLFKVKIMSYCFIYWHFMRNFMRLLRKITLQIMDDIYQ